MSSLNAYLNQKVTVITTDGRCLVGDLKCYDNATNLVLSNTIERIITRSDETEFIELGVYILRGESVGCCGLIDQEIEKDIDWNKVRGKELTSTKHAT